MKGIQIKQTIQPQDKFMYHLYHILGNYIISLIMLFTYRIFSVTNSQGRGVPLALARLMPCYLKL